MPFAKAVAIVADTSLALAVHSIPAVVAGLSSSHRLAVRQPDPGVGAIAAQ